MKRTFTGRWHARNVRRMRLELRHLRAVCTIADTGSVSKAASVLGIAQPALTAQLQRIESTLGAPLFERDRRGVRPTQLGQLVLERARVVLPAVDGLQEEASRIAEQERAVPRYRVGSVNGPFLSGLVQRLTEAEPQAEVITQVSWSAKELAEVVFEGGADFALIGTCGDADAPSERPLTWTTLALDPVFVLLAESHPLAGRSEVALAELADSRWAVTPGDGCFGDCFARECARAGFSPRAVYEVDVASCVGMAQDGQAVVLCQATFRYTPGLVVMPLAGAPLSWRHQLGWRPGSVSPDLVERLSGHALHAYRESVGRNDRYESWLIEHPEFGPQR
ncbi:LysR family transcription regulator [Kutzneria albida DSM 43870]|uniref:LysR family transcription regulator n=2 Tax=Kutzneria TaxID=43356 RepID=W5W1C5_9PSEU|nr:LysR family transcription regulator [Kutzneria albida DSM 43870]